ncbi:MAG TPA: hypothetical protein VMU82_19215 [Acetobacteraceae bacterium]|nr:hypothetical protein [Acetobacteraceae bacterium]
MKGQNGLTQIIASAAVIRAKELGEGGDQCPAAQAVPIEPASPNAYQTIAFIQEYAVAGRLSSD